MQHTDFFKEAKERETVFKQRSRYRFLCDAERDEILGAGTTEAVGATATSPLDRARCGSL